MAKRTGHDQMTIPVVSTAHMPSSDYLDTSDLSDVAQYTEGAFVNLIHLSDGKWIPELKALVKWFRRNYPDQHWIRFDRDGDAVPGVPVHKW